MMINAHCVPKRTRFVQSRCMYRDTVRARMRMGNVRCPAETLTHNRYVLGRVPQPPTNPSHLIEDIPVGKKKTYFALPCN
jgi:hypothetical protein